MSTNIYKIGTSYAGLTSLKSLTVPVTFPYHDFSNFSEVHNLADGSTRGNGSPMIKWTWKFLTRAQRGQLRTFCPSPATSATIYISQLNSEGTETAYLCKMNWPPVEDIQAERVLEFELIFRRLEVVTS